MARQEEQNETRMFRMPLFGMEMLAVTMAVLSGFVLIWAFTVPDVPFYINAVSGVVFTLSIALEVRLMMDPDSVRAHQSDAMLQMASDIIDAVKDGLNCESAQVVCEMLMPKTSAVAVAITDTSTVLGYTGYQESYNPAGTPIRTQATHDVLDTGNALILRTPKEIGLPVRAEHCHIEAAIIEPLWVGNQVEGTLKFYYRSAKHITETQRSIAQGFANLLAAQVAAAEMENQRKLATSMELKMLQSQINPHFLFNTINTISMLIRTDPAKARVMLREFATFYRRTLEDSSERIPLSREIDQVQRYVGFELARFGEDRLELIVDAGEEPMDMMVPPFIVQPLVENAIKHAMPSEGKLTISIRAEIQGDDVVVVVADDGVGMSAETCANITQIDSSTGLGIAVKNVHDRMIGFFGANADMVYSSELGVGTEVSLRFPDCARTLSAETVETEVAEPLNDGITRRNPGAVEELRELVSQMPEPDLDMEPRFS